MIEEEKIEKIEAFNSLPLEIDLWLQVWVLRFHGIRMLSGVYLP